MNRKQQPRKTAAQWQQIIEQQQASGLSASRYCQEHPVAYASFCHWRKRLTRPENVTTTPVVASSAFIDLGTMLPEPSRPWHIVLRLGNGIELCLSQA